MGHSQFLVLLLVSYLLFLSFDHGFGRVELMEIVEHRHSTDTIQIKEYPIIMRKSFEVEDYSEPRPNTNPKNGYIFSPHSPVPATPPRS